MLEYFFVNVVSQRITHALGIRILPAEKRGRCTPGGQLVALQRRGGNLLIAVAQQLHLPIDFRSMTGNIRIFSERASVCLSWFATFFRGWATAVFVTYAPLDMR